MNEIFVQGYDWLRDRLREETARRLRYKPGDVEEEFCRELAYGGTG